MKWTNERHGLYHHDHYIIMISLKMFHNLNYEVSMATNRPTQVYPENKKIDLFVIIFP